MNFEYFIVKRIIDSKAYKSSISAPIIKIGIIAITISIVVMLVAMATGFGLQHKIRDKVVAFNGHITISPLDANNSQESSKNPISIKQDFYPNYNLDGVTHIQAVATKFGVIRTKTDYEAIILKGVGGDYNWLYFKDFLVEGRLPNYKGKRNEDVLISQYLANRLQLQLNDEFSAYFLKDDANKQPNIITYTIVGIYNSNYQEFDETYVFGDIRHIQRINRWKKNEEVGHFELFIDNYNNLDDIGEQVYQNTPSNLNAITVKDKYASVFKWIGIFDKNVNAIIAIMILVAAFNMITSLLVLILERTQMIGVLKALGSNTWSIRKIFLLNASYLVGLGLLCGNSIGLGLVGLQHVFGILEFPDSKTYFTTTIPVYLNIWHVIALNIGTFVLCFIMLLVPSYLISNIAPVKAIKFD